jgi:predicted glycoside hydrolase/deacetylase ChbG (UPF0249 family)
VATTLLERLGRSPDSRLLIVNADDFGMCNAENVATVEGLDAGVYSSTTIMLPCPWSREALSYARARPAADAGVHLTHTSEWQTYKWSPVCGASAVPSLVDELGHFHRDIESVYRLAALDEVERECRAQIEQALTAGVDVTHIDSHMGTMQLDPRYHALYLRLAAEYRLPLRMLARGFLERTGFSDVVTLADELGVLAPDYLHVGGPADAAAPTADYWNHVFDSLRPGVSEIYVHAGFDHPELRACCPQWEARVADHEFFSSPETAARLRRLGIETIGYRALREAQRAG